MRYLSRMLGFLLVPAIALAAAPAGDFRAPAVRKVTDSFHPYTYLIDGIFIMGVELNQKGKIVDVEKWRDPGQMMPVSVASVKTWKFWPAVVDGNPADSTLPVVFVYRPSTLLFDQSPGPGNLLETTKPPDEEIVKKTDYEPPKIMAVSYPKYPANAVQNTSIIIQVSLADSGEVQSVEAVRDVTPFAPFARDALSSWRFEPAKFHGTPVASKVVVVFVFQPPPSSGDE